ncbi:hypothetical protein [Embleya hyalina]|uniref:hypothetical protein n=1 Tax=Embleya hyalina TaxID=516124 RepID=UPI000F83D20A|nr:hypothetical protein [Embleya hyalina]
MESRFDVSEQFVVDLDWLDRLAERFAACADAAGQVLKALEETGPIRTGHKSLDRSCSAFNHKWQENVDTFRGEISELRRGLGVARRNYGTTEHAVATSMTAPQTPPATTATQATPVTAASTAAPTDEAPATGSPRIREFFA